MDKHGGDHVPIVLHSPPFCGLTTIFVFVLRESGQGFSQTTVSGFRYLPSASSPTHDDDQRTEPYELVMLVARGNERRQPPSPINSKQFLTSANQHTIH